MFDHPRCAGRTDLVRTLPQRLEGRRAAKGSARYNFITGSLTLYNAQLNAQDDEVQSSYTDGSIPLFSRNTKAYSMTTSSDGSGAAGRAVIHLIVERGAATVRVDVGIEIGLTSCQLTTEVVPTF